MTAVVELGGYCDALVEARGALAPHQIFAVKSNTDSAGRRKGRSGRNTPKLHAVVDGHVLCAQGQACFKPGRTVFVARRIDIQCKWCKSLMEAQ